MKPYACIGMRIQFCSKIRWACVLSFVACVPAGLAQGTLSSWGYNTDYQLGNGTNTDSPTPASASLWTNGVKAMAGGELRTVVLKPDGTVWSWGDGASGQMGNGTNVLNNVTPVKANISNVIAIAAGYIHTLALTADGKVWGWGSNSNGQLGDGTSGNNRTTPVQVIFAGPVPPTIVKISAGYYHSMALSTDGRVWTWGWNDSGQLGDATNTTRLTPVQINALTNVKDIAT